MTKKYQKIVTVAAAGFLINFIWENLHAPLYSGYRFWAWQPMLIYASLVDAFFVVLLYFVYLARGQCVLVVMLLGLFIAYIVEILALRSGRWSYTDLMPITPFLNVGLTPVLQMICLPVLTYKIVAAFENRS